MVVSISMSDSSGRKWKSKGTIFRTLVVYVISPTS
jgi:hypothetical protein